MTTKYYVLCTEPDKWFAWTEGHFYTSAPFKDAALSLNLVEANRQLGYALRDSPNAKIVTVRITATEVPEHLVKAALLKSAEDKLTDEELRLIRNNQ